MSEKEKTICPECLEPTEQDELDMFGGLCEECGTGEDFNEGRNLGHE